MCEPADTSDYSKQSYWDERYQVEDRFDWFGTAYSSCVELALEQLLIVARSVASAAQAEPEEGRPERHCHHRDHDGCDSDVPTVVRVLHLGCGNSDLCFDLAERYAEVRKENTALPRLEQIAVDYSPVVIERMQQKARELPHERGGVEGDNRSHRIVWRVDDVRRLDTVPTAHVHLVIDKGTMDALQADKDNERLDEELDEMLRAVSRVLVKHPPRQSSVTATSVATQDGAAGGASTASRFVQMTWEIPYYRNYITLKAHYAWGECKPLVRFLGESDVYRGYVYVSN